MGVTITGVLSSRSTLVTFFPHLPVCFVAFTGDPQTTCGPKDAVFPCLCIACTAVWQWKPGPSHSRLTGWKWCIWIAFGKSSMYAVLTGTASHIYGLNVALLPLLLTSQPTGWLGYVLCMGDERYPRQALFSLMHDAGAAPRGSPPISWEKYVTKDLQSLQLPTNMHDLHGACELRGSWRSML